LVAFVSFALIVIPLRMVLNGVCNDGPNGLATIDRETALTNAMRIIEFILELAEREESHG
jgi:hypothetical protein